MITINKSKDILLISAKKIDKNLWNLSLNNSFNNNPLFSYELLETSYKGQWSAIVKKDFSCLLPLPIKKQFINYKISFSPYHFYTTIIFKNKKCILEVWNHIFDFLKRIKIKNSIYFANIPDNKLQITQKTFFKLDLPYGMSLIQNNKFYQIFEHKIHNLGLYTIYNINTNGILLFLLENIQEKYEILFNLIKQANNQKKLFSIGVYNKNSKLIYLSIFLYTHTRIYLLYNILLKDSKIDTNLCAYLVLVNLIQYFHNKNITLEIPPYIDFVYNLPFKTIFKKIPLYKLSPKD